MSSRRRSPGSLGCIYYLQPRGSDFLLHFLQRDWTSASASVTFFPRAFPHPNDPRTTNRGAALMTGFYIFTCELPLRFAVHFLPFFLLFFYLSTNVTLHGNKSPGSLVRPEHPSGQCNITALASAVPRQVAQARRRITVHLLAREHRSLEPRF